MFPLHCSAKMLIIHYGIGYSLNILFKFFVSDVNACLGRVPSSAYCIIDQLKLTKVAYTMKRKKCELMVILMECVDILYNSFLKETCDLY